MRTKLRTQLQKPNIFFKVFKEYLSKGKFKSSDGGKFLSFKELNENNPEWTKWMEELMQRMADEQGYQCFNNSAPKEDYDIKEIMEIDHIVTNKLRGNDWYRKAIPLIAVEHENCQESTYVENLEWSFWKLLHITAKLKVLIGYPKKEHTQELLKIFSYMIKEREKIFSIPQNVLVLFGYKKEIQWEYSGYNFKNGEFYLIA